MRPMSTRGISAGFCFAALPEKSRRNAQATRRVAMQRMRAMLQVGKVDGASYRWVGGQQGQFGEISFYVLHGRFGRVNCHTS